ncbi:rhodanese-like domain-containing protein [Litoribrevibacter albus]|uniref:Rhodanese-like domain-containing protein n=1 Tax=Litoribrevibacter albus TaxID=1473156 RepID=A0AA37W9M6_9GAMM|nr:rhodanese-like domain-containing protein [Litoribrevibacter albus]GLQ33524.1 rhodanese-like domain-containing protein [Litoribrevibacter albus]
MEQFFEFATNNAMLVGAWVVLLVLFIISETRKGGKTLSAQQVIMRMNKEEALILDVRDKADYKKGHIINSINIPYASLDSRVTEIESHKEKPVVVVCKMGQTSNAAGSILRKHGFTDVTRLAGGMAEWTSLNLPVE